ncbi:MAG: aldehyde dehydrogenase family protein [Cyclobacteriaceae bacterium]
MSTHLFNTDFFTKEYAYSTGIDFQQGKGNSKINSYSPIDNQLLGSCQSVSKKQYDEVIETAQQAFKEWKEWPAPLRGEVVRQIGDELRKNKDELGRLVTLEMGKSLQEGLGEVQEMIDICDFATGLSRQLHGFTMHSERKMHRMYEQYHPLGIVGVISAFNFPVAVWAWNAMLALICGDVVVWKPSEKTPLCGVACHDIIKKVLADNKVPEGTVSLVVGEREVGEWIAEDKRITLVSATGSTRMGKEVAKTVGARLGKTILELGGNNAIIVTEHADLSLAIPAIVFGAVGTAGQRCTSTRRVIIHESMYDAVKERLLKAYKQIKVGNPLDQSYHMGPLIDQDAVASYSSAIQQVVTEGGKVITGDKVIQGNYVTPTIVEADNGYQMVQDETFAPIMYLLEYSGTVSDAIDIQNNVKQGLSSAIFSDNIKETETFLAHWGSDCGIANVNIGTSGAEIGGAFGGEKETGGGRESGSDAWKAYMRRQTNTINFSTDLPLAQGIKFDF